MSSINPDGLRRWAAIIALATMAVTAPVSADEPSQPRYVPDFSGYWSVDPGLGFRRAPPMPGARPSIWRGLGGYAGAGNAPPPLRPELIDRIRIQRANEETETRVGGDVKACVPANNFDMMTWSSDPIDIVQRDDEVVVLPEKERSVPRHIYIGARHPAQVPLTPNGHSVGHWEGDTLVTDTVGIDPAAMMMFGDYIPHSAKMHVVERLHLDSAGASLVAEWVINDPEVLTGPWKLTVSYVRGPFGMEAMEAACDVDLRGDAFGK